MAENLKRIAELLKKARDEKGKTLEDISRETKIKVEYLEAIEKGDISPFPAPIYIRGYIKAYANTLGLNHKPFIELLNDFYRREGKHLKRAESIELQTEKIETIGNKKALPISSGGIILVAAFIAILLSLIFVFKGKGKHEPLTKAEGLTALVDTSMVKGIELVKAGENVSQTIYVNFGYINPIWAIARVDSLTLDVNVLQNMGLLAETDYKRVFKGYVKAGEHFTWRAQKAFFLTVDKPQALKLYLNGFELKSLPLSPVPLDVYITRENISSLLVGINSEQQK